MTTSHTPTPWEKCGGATPSYTCIKAGNEYIVYGMADNLVDEEHGKPIAAPDMWKQQANAAHIVKCVNMHDELVEVIKSFGDETISDEVFNIMRNEVLKKAGAI